MATGRGLLWALAGLGMIVTVLGFAILDTVKDPPAPHQPVSPVVSHGTQANTYQRSRHGAGQTSLLPRPQASLSIQAPSSRGPTPTQRAVVLLREGRKRLRAGDREAARDAFREALSLDANLATAHRFLAELSYEADDIAQAITHWEQYLALRPEDRSAARRLARARREAATNPDFVREATRHFIVKFDGRADDGTRRDVLHILEDAYREIGQRLNYYTSREVMVILYTQRQFRDITQSPAWVGALYDGKIRVPVGGYRRSMDALRRVLYHEYTHALIRDFLQGRCPKWLNEGLAQYFAGQYPRIGDAGLRSLAREGRLLPLRSLNGSFMGFNARQAKLAYAQSASVTRYLIQRYGLSQVLRFLELVRERKNVEQAMDWAFSLDTERLDQRWRDRLREG